MVVYDLQDAFFSACRQQGLNPANTNHFLLECHRRGLDPQATTMADLDRDASPLWSDLRRPKQAIAG
jgi:hypothetical protein